MSVTSFQCHRKTLNAIGYIAIFKAKAKEKEAMGENAFIVD